MSENLIRAWMPITKKADGTFEGILSDTSLDRDSEFMTKELLEQWSRTKALPMLLNHENKMEKLVGVWKGLRTITKGRRTALVAQPHFFSEDANPLAQQAKKQVEEALSLGMNPGISIGAIPAEEDATVEKEVDGKVRRGFAKAELVEATLVPVQSNRNASFASVAKEFDLSPKETEEVQKSEEMNDPDLTPEEGITKEESTRAVCQSQAKSIKEETTMEKTYSQAEVDALIAKQVEEALAKEAEANAEEEMKEEEAKKEEEEKKSVSEELSAMKKMIEEMGKKRFADLTKAPTVEHEAEEEPKAEVPKELDMAVMLKHYYK